jgi:hypothetical protein
MAKRTKSKHATARPAKKTLTGRLPPVRPAQLADRQPFYDTDEAKPATSKDVMGVTHIRTPKNAIPVVLHDPNKDHVTVVHVEPEKVKDMGWLRWLFGSE